MRYGRGNFKEKNRRGNVVLLQTVRSLALSGKVSSEQKNLHKPFLERTDSLLEVLAKEWSLERTNHKLSSTQPGKVPHSSLESRHTHSPTWERKFVTQAVHPYPTWDISAVSLCIPQSLTCRSHYHCLKMSLLTLSSTQEQYKLLFITLVQVQNDSLPCGTKSASGLWIATASCNQQDSKPSQLPSLLAPLIAPVDEAIAS